MRSGSSLPRGAVELAAKKGNQEGGDGIGVVGERPMAAVRQGCDLSFGKGFANGLPAQCGNVSELVGFPDDGGVIVQEPLLVATASVNLG
ncbi:MAG: hypothetical protein ACK5AZ_09545 [Bryobacteraceae bacterium]